MDDGNGWKIIQFYITSNDIFNKIIGYDWIIWVLGNEPKYES